MDFKTFYNNNEFYEILIEKFVCGNYNRNNLIESFKLADVKSSFAKALGPEGLLGVATKVKDKLSSDDSKKAISLAGAAIDSINSAVNIVKGGSGQGNSGSAGGGIFTSILRYNNPILKKITPEDESIKAIEEIVNKMNFVTDKEKITDIEQWAINFREFITNNPLPSEEIYKTINDLLINVKGIKVHKTDIIQNKVPKKETKEQQKARINKSSKYEKDWNIKFKEFLNDEKLSSATREELAPLLLHYNIKIKINVEEIKDDLSVLYKKVFTRETLQFGVSLTKAMKNFVLVVISVYLLKLIKKMAFS